MPPARSVMTAYVRGVHEQSVWPSNSVQEKEAFNAPTNPLGSLPFVFHPRTSMIAFDAICPRLPAAGGPDGAVPPMPAIGDGGWPISSVRIGNAERPLMAV